MEKTVGETYPAWYRYLVGYGCMFLVLVLAIGPMFMFSSFDIFGDVNPVQQAQLGFTLVVSDTPYRLFSTQTITTKIENLNQTQYDATKFTFDQELHNVAPDQVQYFKMSEYPQERWAISENTGQLLIDKLKTIKNNTMPEDLKDKIKLEVQYGFTRNYPTDALSPSGVQTLDVSLEIVEKFIDQLTKMTTQDADEVVLEDFEPLIYLDAST